MTYVGILNNNSMKKKVEATAENPNDHVKKTPSTKGKEKNAKAFTSYDTSQQQSESPQKVRENRESPADNKPKGSKS